MKTLKKCIYIKIANYKRLISSAETAEKVMIELSYDKDNELDTVVLLPEKVDARTDNEDINKNQVDKQRLPNNVLGKCWFMQWCRRFNGGIIIKHQNRTVQYKCSKADKKKKIIGFLKRMNMIKTKQILGKALC